MKKMKYLKSMLIVVILFFIVLDVYSQDNVKEEVNIAYQELDRYLNSSDYINIADNLVYTPIFSLVDLNDERVSHLIGSDGFPINPLTKNTRQNNFKDGGSSSFFENLIVDNIDFTEIDGKVYYRLFVEPSNLIKVIPVEVLDLDNYPDFILLEILEDINKISEEYFLAGADSIVQLNSNAFRVYKPQAKLRDYISLESGQLDRLDYPGFYTYARLENALYLPIKNSYPEDLKEDLSKRTTNSRHFKYDDGTIDAQMSMRPTSYPVLPEFGVYDLQQMEYYQRVNLKWVEIPACYPTPRQKATKNSPTSYFDETFYGHSVYCTNDESAPYVWICTPDNGNFLGTIGALSDDDALSGEEYNYNRIHEKFDITSIPDCATVNTAEFETYLPDIAPYVTGDCDGTIYWEEVKPEIKDMTTNMTATNNPEAGGAVDSYSWTWFNDVEDGLVFYVDYGWNWDRGDYYTGYDCDFNSLGLTDVESRLVGNYFMVGVADEDEDNQSPTFWEAVANWGYYSNFKINYTTHPNDLCSEALNISLLPYDSGTVSNSCAQNETMPTSSCSTIGATVWYEFTGTGNQMTISTDNVGTSLDTELRLFSGTCASLTEMSCDDDSGSGSTSVITFCSTASTTYYVVVGYYSSTLSYGNYQLSIIDYPVGTPTGISADNTIICNGTSTNVNATPGTNGEEVHWYTGSCGGTYVNTGNAVSVSPTVTTTYYARTYDTDCSIYSPICVSVVVNVDPLPTALAGGSQSVCINESAVVGGASFADGTILWTHDGNGTLTDETTLSPTYNPALGDEGTTITLTMTVTSNNICSPLMAQATYTVNVDQLPTATAGGSQTICVNQTATVSGVSASNGIISWIDDGAGSITSGETTLTPVYTPSMGDAGNTITLTMTVTSDNECNPYTDFDTYTVIVEPLSTAIAGGSATICPEDIHIVSGASVEYGTILWSHDGNGSLTDETTLTPTYTSVVADEGNLVTLTLTVTSNNTCNPETAIANYSINVSDLPTVPVIVNSDINYFCEDDAGDITLSATGGIGTSIRWYDDVCDGNEIGTDNPLILPSPVVTTTYFARNENSCGVSDCTSKIITVVSPPVAPDEAVSNIDDFCADDAGNIELSVNGGSGITVQWFTGSCGGSSIGIGNPLIIPSPDVTTEYFARWENACGESSCVSVVVKVNALPVAPTEAIVDRNDFCSDDLGVIELSVTGGLGTDVVWFTESCGGNLIGTGNPLSVASPSVSTTYYGRWESTCGITSCESVVVNVIAFPVAPTFVSTDVNNICVDDAGTINLSSVGGSGETLTWYTGSCEGTDIGTSNPINIESPTETTEYFVSWENLCGVSDCESVVVTVIDAPTDPISVDVDINDICEDDTGNISLSITGGVGPEVYWYSGSCGVTLIGTGTPLVIESPSITTTYYARYESSCGNSNCVDVTVNIIALPTSPISAESDLNNICANDDGNIALSVTGGLGDDVHWFDDVCGGNEIGIGNPLIIPSPEINTTYFARWENSCGESICQNITIITLASADATINPAGPFCQTDGVVVITPVEGGGTWAGIAIDPVTGLFDPAVAGVGDHLISYTISGICGDFYETTISVVNSFDPTIDAVADLCSDDLSIILAAADIGGTWSGIGIVDAENGIFDPSIAGVGDHVITYGSVGGCGGTDDVTITVNAAADATINPVGPFCATDDPIVVTAAQIGGTWAGTSIDPVTGFFDPEVAGVGDHVITYTLTGDCEDNDEITIIVLPILDPTIDAVADLCASDSEVILTAVDIGGEWTGVGITDTDLGTFDPTIAGIGTHTITYTLSGSCGSSDDIDITVNPSADATINLVGEFCENDSPLVLTANQSGGTWSGDGVDPASGFFNPATAGPGDHLITYTIVGDCGDNDEITISILPSLDPTIDPVNELCSDESPITLNAVDSGGIWAGDGITDDALGIFDPSVAGEGIHAITYTFEGNCGSSDDINIIVNLAADATITPVGPFCVTDDPFVVTAAQVGGTWSGSTIDPVTGFFDPEIAGPGEHVIIYTITGDCEDTDQIIIVVQAIFDATIDPIDDICSNADPIILSAADLGGIWSGDGITDENAGTFDPSLAGVGDHIITYTFTGACGVFDDIEITVLESADATIDAVDPLCEGADAFVVTAAETGGEWSGPGINATTGFFDPDVAGIGDHIITYTVSGVCEDTDQITISILEYADATITVDLDYCLDGNTYNLEAITDGGVWSGTGITDEGVFNPELAGEGTSEIIYTIGGLCGDADSITVNVYPVADATITSVDTLTDEDAPVQLITAQDVGIWNSIFVDAFGIFNPNEAGVALHQVIYTIEGPCGDADTIDIVVIATPISDLLVSTALTPDNDGYNDTWRIQGIEVYANVSIRIFSRWGDEVFVFDGTGDLYEDVNNQWNGKFNDRDLPTGSYLYVLVLGDDVYKGTISLIR
jgi:gliding motility-associated-like protein